MANKKLNKNRHEFTLTIDGERWAKLVNEAFQKVVKDAKVDGFRKGHVPKNIFDKKYGKESYLVEAANKVVSEEFTRIMKEEKYELVAEPQIHINTLEEEKIEFTMALIEQPEVNVKKYKGLNIKKEEVTVTDEEIDHELSHLLERFSELVAKDGKIENGDTVVFDFEGSVDGVPFDGGKAENYSLEIGSGMFIPGFEEQMVGMGKEEEKDLRVTFPEDYHEESLKGKEAVFKVKTHEIKTKKTRELDEEFFEDLALPEVKDEKTLRDEIKKSIEAQKETDAENKYVDSLIEEVCKNTEVDIPEEMVYDTVEMMIKDFEQKLAMQGISLEIYKQYTKKTDEDIKNDMEPQAYQRVLARLTLEKIKELENIEVTDEEVDSKVKELAEKYNMKEEEIVKHFGGKLAIKYDTEMNKVIAFLKDANK